LPNADWLYEGRNANERRTLYANALNQSLEILVSYTEKDADDILSNGLEPIAAATGLNRIIVFRIFGKDAMLCGERYRRDRIIGGTVPIISDDSCISLKRSEFKENEAAFLAPRGVMSILIVPTFTKGKFWGVVACHDNSKERDFDKGCIDMLRPTVRMCASTIIKAEKTRSAKQTVEALRRRKKISDTLNKVFLIFLSENEKKVEDTMAAGVYLVIDMAEIEDGLV
jgi:hypothetical protein